jgi:large subunit ribosomal protein L29
MRVVELRGLDDAEVLEQVAVARKELFGLRFQHATGELENTAGLRHAKQQLARALTIARERGINPEKTA